MTPLARFMVIAVQSRYSVADAATGKANTMTKQARFPALDTQFAAQTRPFDLAFGTLVAWYRRSLERHDLGHLTDRQLDDTGLTRRALRHEAEKPFWRR